MYMKLINGKLINGNDVLNRLNLKFKKKNFM